MPMPHGQRPTFACCCLVFVLVACLFHHLAAAQTRRPVAKAEAELLLEIKRAWGDPPSLEAWSTAASAAGAHCCWPYVQCDSTGHVNKLELTGINVTGSIPDAVCGLSNLVEFYVASSSITGAFPTALYHCKSLQYLDLSLNYIGGNLPDDVGHRLGAKLSMLDLSNNLFHGAIPSSLSRLRNLRCLRLEGNLFTGTIPVELGELTRLEVLNLSDNPFDAGKLPASFTNLTKLVVLSAMNCSLIGDLSCVLEMAESLKVLDLSQNSLTGSIPRGVWNLRNLEMLDLSQNSLTGSIPIGVWGLRNLQSLLVYSNNLTGNLVVDGFAATSLTNIDVSKNKLTGVIPIFEGLESLQTLVLSNNRFTGILPPEFGKHLPSLSEVRIDGNELIGAIPEGLCEAPLSFLNASSNQLNGSIPVCLTNSPTLIALFLDNNQLSGEVPESLWTIAQLDPTILRYNRRVKLRNNRLTGSLPTTMSSTFRELDIGNNQFVGKIPSVAVGLVYFDADNNQFSGEIPANLDYGMPLLQRLNLANNKLYGRIS